VLLAAWLINGSLIADAITWAGVIVVAVTGAGIVATAIAASYPAMTPRIITVRWPKRKDLSAGFMGGLAYRLTICLLMESGFGFWLWHDGTGPAVLMVGGGLLSGLVVGITVGPGLELLDIWRVPIAETLDATPRLIHQKDVKSELVGALLRVFGFSIVIAFLFVLWVLAAVGWWDDSVGWREALDRGLATGVWLGACTGLWIGVAVELWAGFAQSAACRLLFAEVALSLRGRPVRFMPLLERALGKQVLRQAGAVYQFRHADLQDRLAERYAAGITGDSAT
jgi:hypothetical protein